MTPWAKFAAMLIDTHTHIYLPDFANDIESVLDRARLAGVTHCCLPAIDSETHDLVIGLESRFPGSCHAMIGLHPCSVNERVEEELALVRSWLEKRPFIAIGETGLDFYWDKTFVQEQEMALRRQMEWAIEFNLPIVLHTRDANQAVIDIAKEYAPRGLRGVFHCFGGTYEEASQITDMGFFMGIGGVLTYKKSGLQELMPMLSIDHIVLETDAPYLSPVPYRGKRNEPAYLTQVFDLMARVLNMEKNALEEKLTENSLRLFPSLKG